MRELLTSELMLIGVTVAIYLLSKAVCAKFKNTILNPMLISILFMVGYLKLIDVDYEMYVKATKVIDLMLGLSVVALGCLLYEQRLLLKQNVITILVLLLSNKTFAVINNHRQSISLAVFLYKTF